MKIYLLITAWCLFLSGNLIARTTITGIVTDSLNAPIPYASVYFSGTTVGTLTNAKGSFTLTIPQDGTYELICSCIGFKTHSQIIQTEGSSIKINIQLPEHIVLMKEVLVKGNDPNRPENYAQFLKSFIGRTENATFCTIENQTDLILYRDTTDNNLIAYSLKPLIITNSSFGYKIIYDLEHFQYNLNTKHLRFSGKCYFEDISNQKLGNSRTKRNRQIAYYGSRMHFLRALFADSLSQENFKIYDTHSDLQGNWLKLPKTLHETDLRVALTTDSMTLYHANPVAITYKNNHLNYDDHSSREFSSVILFSDTLQVYKNGYYAESYNLSWGGNMSYDRIAEMLPYDFVPKAKRK